MADVASIIGAVCAGAATLITAWSAYRTARSQDHIREEQERQAKSTEALKVDHERSARDTGRRLYGLIDKVNTLDDRTSTVARRVEKIPTDSQWAFRLGQTPTGRLSVQNVMLDDEPLTEKMETVPLKGPTPPKIPPLDDDDER